MSNTTISLIVIGGVIIASAIAWAIVVWTANYFGEWKDEIE